MNIHRWNQFSFFANGATNPLITGKMISFLLLIPVLMATGPNGGEDPEEKINSQPKDDRTSRRDDAEESAAARPSTNPEPTSGGSSSGSPGKRKENSGAGPSRPRKKPESREVPSGIPTCHICGKEFFAWHCIHGHMRVHKDREWRGALPPPTWTEEEETQAERVAKGLVDVAEGAMATAAEKRVPRMPFDLNEPLGWEEGVAEPMEEGTTAREPEEEDKKESENLDLNKDPSPGNGDEGKKED